MEANHPSDEELILVAYGEADRGAIASHLDACADCQAALREIQRTLETVSAHEIPERGVEYGALTWARLQPRLGPPPARRWWTWFTPPRLAFGAGVAMLLVAAFVAGRYSLRVPPAQVAVNEPAGSATPVSGPAATGQVRDRVLLVAVGDHLERSQMVLVELMNRPDTERVDISTTQEWARELVPANRLIRQTASQAGEAMVADVLGDLERLLVEIANGPSRLSAADFQRVRERIEAGDIVFKIRVLDSQVRGQQETEPARTARTRS